MPAFNEKGAIATAVSHVQQALALFTTDSEIIVVDDGSTDGTAAELDAIVASGGVRILQFPENRGYGAALRSGFAAATRPLVFFTDSDDQFDPMDLGRLLPAIERADIVIGHRASRSDGALRNVLSGCYNQLVRLLLDVRVRDINCAFKLVRREALVTLALVSDGYSINAEMLARAARAGLRVHEVAVTHRPRAAGQSKVGVRNVPGSLMDLLSVRRLVRNSKAAVSTAPLARK